MAYNIKVEMNSTSKILKRLNLDKQGKVRYFFRDKVAEECDPYVPMVSGQLADYTTHGTEIWYDTPYAKYQYWGARDDLTHLIKTANRNREKHPLATSFWDRHLWTAKKDEIAKDVKKEIERLAKE